jgi:hypothetical protein
MTSMLDPVLDLEPDFAASLDAELGLLGLLGTGGSASLVAGVADPGLPVPLGLATGLLADVDPYALDGDARVDLIRALDRCRAMLDAVQQRAIAAVAEATEGLGRPAEEARHEVAAALRLCPGTAAGRLEVARELVHRLPAVQALLQAGAIGYLQAAAIAAGVRDLPDELSTAVADRVLRTAPDHTVAETKRSVARAAQTVDPATAADRHQRATANRTIEQMAQPDGMESTWATMPASVSTDLWETLTADAKTAQAHRKAAGLPFVGLNALRVDALVHAVLGNGGADPHHPTMTTVSSMAAGTSSSGRESAEGAAADAAAEPEGLPPETPKSGSPAGSRLPRCRCGGAQTAAVVVDLPTLLGLADRPGEIPGYGPIPAPAARVMAADRDWVRWLVDPGTGALLDLGADRYRPSDPLRRFIAARDRRCGFPGCSKPAQACDCDHVVTFSRRGRTITVNLGPLCRQHHNAKTHGLWRLSYDPDTGIKTWTSPLGKTYTVGTDPPLT